MVEAQLVRALVESVTGSTVAADRISVVAAFDGMGKIRVVQDFVAEVLINNNISLAALRRKLHHRNKVAARRPHALYVEEMWDPRICGHGAVPLPLDMLALDAQGWDADHRLFCGMCKDGIHPRCYWHEMRLCLTCGILPVMVEGGERIPQQLYACDGPDGNHKSSWAYEEFLAKQVVKLMGKGIVQVVPPGLGVYVSPIGVTVPKSKSRQLEVLTGVKVRDDASFEHAVSLQLEVDDRLMAPKRRMVFDATASGLNAMLAGRPFSSSDISDAIELMTPGCQLWVTDIEGHFPHFAMAPESWKYLGFRFRDTLYGYIKAPFGVKTMPYIASTFSAEVVRSLQYEGIPCTVMQDDFLTVGGDDTEIDSRGGAVEANLRRKGFTIADDKRQKGQSVVYLGYQLDSVSYTAGINPASAAGFYLCLVEYMEILRGGGHVSYSLWRHVAGKLDDYTKVVQRGKCMMGSTWWYLNERKHQRTPLLVSMEELMTDLSWWMQSLEVWRRDPSQGAYPILNGQSIRDDPSLLEVVVSDMAGEDGVAVYYGSLEDTDPLFFSEQWPVGDKAIHSFEGELRALRNHLRRRLALSQQHCVQLGTDMVTALTFVKPLETSSLSVGAARRSSSLSPSLVLWCTDCESASHSINSGRCIDPHGLVVVKEIFEIAELLSITLLSLWHPRTDTAAIIADNLSHLAASLCRESIAGRLSTVEGIRTAVTSQDGGTVGK
jgi:hypothetical protein